jgi:hypothetical protein
MNKLELQRIADDPEVQEALLVLKQEGITTAGAFDRLVRLSEEAEGKK